MTKETYRNKKKPYIQAYSHTISLLHAVWLISGYNLLEVCAESDSGQTEGRSKLLFLLFWATQTDFQTLKKKKKTFDKRALQAKGAGQDEGSCLFQEMPTLIREQLKP